MKISEVREILDPDWHDVEIVFASGMRIVSQARLRYVSRVTATYIEITLSSHAEAFCVAPRFIVSIKPCRIFRKIRRAMRRNLKVERKIEVRK